MNFLAALKSKTSSPLLSQLKRRVRSIVRRDSRIPINSVRWGDFRRHEPICRDFGYSRGKPIDRHYIEAFLAQHAEDVRGRVLEIKDGNYTGKFGGPRVQRSDVLDLNPANSAATIIGDLGDPETLESEAYDCVIFTQTLQYLFEPANAVANLHRSLRPGGVLLLTVPGITPIRECGADWYWNFTSASVERLLSEQFGAAAVVAKTCGNLASATGYLHGLSARELRDSDLARQDPAYQLLIVARAVKAMP